MRYLLLILLSLMMGCGEQKEDPYTKRRNDYEQSIHGTKLRIRKSSIESYRQVTSEEKKQRIDIEKGGTYLHCSWKEWHYVLESYEEVTKKLSEAKQDDFVEFSKWGRVWK